MDVDNITNKLPDPFKVGGLYISDIVHTKHCAVTPPTQTYTGPPGEEPSEATGV